MTFYGKIKVTSQPPRWPMKREKDTEVKKCDENWIRGLKPKMGESMETDYFTLTKAIEIMIYDLSSTERHFKCDRSEDLE